MSGNGSVTLTWDPVDGATSYEIFRAGAQIGTSASASFTDTTAVNGATYVYTVRAVGLSGETADSNSISAMAARALCVADTRQDQIQVFNAEVTNAAPTRSFGSRTGLASSAVAIDGTHLEIFSANGDLNTVTTHLIGTAGNRPASRTLVLATAPRAIAYDPADDTLLVASDFAVDTFGRTASGIVAPVRTLTSASFFLKIALTGAAHGDRLFALQFDDQAQAFVINGYHRKDSAAAAPFATITSPAFTGARVISIAYDPDHDEVLVGAFNFSEQRGHVFAFPASSSGDTAPARQLDFSPSGPSFPRALAATGGRLFVGNDFSQVFGYPSDFSQPDDAPFADLEGTNTRINRLDEIAADSTSGTIAVASDGELLYFGILDDGNVEPVGAFSGASTGVSLPGGLAADKAHGELFVANGGAGASLTAYPLSAEGDVTPARTFPLLSPNASPGLALDAAHDELIAVPAFNAEVDFFARSAASGAASVRRIRGPGTHLVAPTAVGLDVPNDVVVVLDQSAIRRYRRAFTDGNQAPLTSIQGAATALAVPSSLFVDDTNAEIVVADTGGITVFGVRDDGNVAPKRHLNGPAARGVLVDGEELFVIEEEGFAIKAYSRTASGSDAPLRTILPSSSGAPVGFSGMAICN